MQDIVKLYKKHREPILYIFFGGLTTLVNIVVYTALAGLPPNRWIVYSGLLAGKFTTVAATGAAWILSVAFAYITNRIWVFRSGAHEPALVLREIALFFAARLLSGLLDMAIMYYTVDVLDLNKLGMKIASNVLVIILNYFLSKLLIFKNKTG